MSQNLRSFSHPLGSPVRCGYQQGCQDVPFIPPCVKCLVLSFPFSLALSHLGTQGMASEVPRTIKASAPVKSSGFLSGYTTDHKVPPMLRFEASLPRLPVPSFISTGTKYLESVRPHLTPAEFERTQNVVKSFVQSDLGKKLQESSSSLSMRLLANTSRMLKLPSATLLANMRCTYAYFYISISYIGFYLPH